MKCQECGTEMYKDLYSHSCPKCGEILDPDEKTHRLTHDEAVSEILKSLNNRHPRLVVECINTFDPNEPFIEYKKRQQNEVNVTEEKNNG